MTTSVVYERGCNDFSWKKQRDRQCAGFLIFIWGIAGLAFSAQKLKNSPKIVAILACAALSLFGILLCCKKGDVSSSNTPKCTDENDYRDASQKLEEGNQQQFNKSQQCKTKEPNMTTKTTVTTPLTKNAASTGDGKNLRTPPWSCAAIITGLLSFGALVSSVANLALMCKDPKTDCNESQNQLHLGVGAGSIIAFLIGIGITFKLRVQQYQNNRQRQPARNSNPSDLI